jgi:hypothetical protein
MTGKCWQIDRWVIEPRAIIITKETEKTFTTESKDWRGDTRESKHMKASTNIFATWADAKAFLVQLAETALECAKQEVDRKRSALEEAKALKDPTHD